MIIIMDQNSEQLANIHKVNIAIYRSKSLVCMHVGWSGIVRPTAHAHTYIIIYNYNAHVYWKPCTEYI